MMLSFLVYCFLIYIMVKKNTIYCTEAMPMCPYVSKLSSEKTHLCMDFFKWPKCEYIRQEKVLRTVVVNLGSNDYV